MSELVEQIVRCKLNAVRSVLDRMESDSIVEVTEVENALHELHDIETLFHHVMGLLHQAQAYVGHRGVE